MGFCKGSHSKSVTYSTIRYCVWFIKE